MKSILHDIRARACRSREITSEEMQSFSEIDCLQRYFPAMERFDEKGGAKTPCSELPSRYWISQWGESSSLSRRFALRQHTDSETKEEPCEVYLKTVHLLNPFDVLKGKYAVTHTTPLLIPQMRETHTAWKNTLRQLHHVQNQAYVDAVAYYLLSAFREKDLTPHCILYYGAYTGIHQKYTFNITNEYDTYRHHRWFWKGMKHHRAQLKVRACYEEDESHPDFQEIVEDLLECPFDADELEGADSDKEDDTVLHTDPTVEEVSVDELPGIEELSFDSMEEKKGDSRHATASSASSTSSASSLCSELLPEVDVTLELSSMPVMVIAQEAMEGVMDDLLDEEEVDGCEHGTQGWEARWIAWIFQVIAALSFLQGTIRFTHNDLHSNNILWKSTKKKYLYYRSRDGTVWRVPTYGKIFYLIDFGRSIFRIGRDQWISDDHWPDQDAGDQYNFGPFYDSSLPKVMPNMSFDLCRLAISLIDGLFDEHPPKKKAVKQNGVKKEAEVLSEEGSWIVYETRSPLFNLLWSWTVDDAGRTVYENEQGDEKYGGFDLYIRIAQDVHSAVPKEQIRRPMFRLFQFTSAVPSSETIYDLRD